jgi:hypothetical protein
MDLDGNGPRLTDSYRPTVSSLVRDNLQTETVLTLLGF